MQILCTKLNESFEVPFDSYSPEAKANAIVVGLHRIVNDAMAGVVRKDFPTGVAGDEAFRDVGRRKVRVRLANLANADRPVGPDPLAGLSPEERAAVEAIRAKNAKKAA
jgi:hypothetical protein